MAFDAFIKIEGVTDNLPGGELQLESFSWGVSNPNSAGSGATGGSGGRVTFQDFSFTTAAGRHSPKLFEAVATGQRVTTAILTITDKTEPLAVRFTDVFISGYKLDEGALFSQKLLQGDLPAVQLGAPLENVTFNFAKIEFSVGGNTTTGGSANSSQF
jgi:type VI protein secretion system component Hcp